MLLAVCEGAYTCKCENAAHALSRVSINPHRFTNPIRQMFVQASVTTLIYSDAITKDTLPEGGVGEQGMQ